MTLFGPVEGALGIRDLYRRVGVAIARGFRGEVWVRAEISALREKNGWCFLTLAEPARDHDEADAFLDVVVWRAPWGRIRSQLEGRGLALREGMTVSLRGKVGLRPGTGRLQLDASALDTDALLGELTARRQALRRALAAEGVLDANRRLALPPVPLRVGLVASHHSQGYEDFRAVLTASGYDFVLTERAVAVQGVGAPRAVAAALAGLTPAEVDVVVIVRGGGARADLDAFDSEVVARAVAAAAVPVWTGVGHTGDRYLADEAAAASHATPTACAQALVSRVAAFEQGVAARIRRFEELARRVGDAAQGQLDGRRFVLSRATAAQLDRHADGVARRAGGVRSAGGRALAAASVRVGAAASFLPRVGGAAVEARGADVGRRAADLGRAAGGGLARGRHQLEARAAAVGGLGGRAGRDAERDLAASRRVLAAFDPTRQLARGWTLTLDSEGVLVRRAAALRPGQRITSRFVDGDRTSVVEAVPR